MGFNPLLSCRDMRFWSPRALAGISQHWLVLYLRPSQEHLILNDVITWLRRNPNPGVVYVCGDFNQIESHEHLWSSFLLEFSFTE